MKAIVFLFTVLIAGAFGADQKCAYLKCRSEFRPTGDYCAYGDLTSYCKCQSGTDDALLVNCPRGQVFNEYLNRCGEDNERNRRLCNNFFHIRGMGPSGK